MDFMTSIKTCFSKYFDFSGRARRSEFWWFYLFLIACSFLTGIVDAVIGVPVAGGLFSLATIIPIIAAGARRLHDTGRSGWWQLMPVAVGAIGSVVAYMLNPQLVWAGIVAALIAGIMLIVWLASDTHAGPNQYGPSPK